MEAITHLLHEITGSPVGLDTPLMDAGVDSVLALEFVGKLELELELELVVDQQLSPTILFEYSTVRALVRHLSTTSLSPSASGAPLAAPAPHDGPP
jgi:acyl carrier protein